MSEYTGYTTAELRLQLILHDEGRVTQPRKLLDAVRREIKEREAKK